MSLIKEYISERRHKKLEEINRALEQLKHENVATDGLKPKTVLSTPVSHPPMRTGKDLLFIGILLVCVVILIITTFFYRGQYAALNDSYQEKVDKLTLLEADLQKKIDDLEATQEERDRLKISKESTQEELDDLESEVEDLQMEVDKLEDEIKIKRAEVDNLTRVVSQQRNEINDWKDCIEDELEQNLSVCD